MKQYKYHSLARYFPVLPPDEFQKLKESIEQIGQLEPITLFEGKILDGRNRYEACRELDIEPALREFLNGVEPLEFVFAANMRRRHLTEAQKVQIDFDIHGPSQAMARSDSRRGGVSATADTPRSHKEVARDLGVSDTTVSRIAEVQDDPKIKAELREGKITARKAVIKRMSKVADTAKIEPTLKGMYARAPGTKLIMEKLSEIKGGATRWITDAALAKIDPKGHTPLMIKRVDEAISALQTFRAKLEEIQSEG